MSQNKRSNHENAPLCAAFVEELREVFGADQVRVLWVREGDFKLGEKDDHE